MRRDPFRILEKINKLYFTSEVLDIKNLIFKCLHSTENVEELEGISIQVHNVEKYSFVSLFNITV